MPRHPDDLSKTLLQIVAIVVLIGLVAMVLHKGFADVSVLWQQHSGDGFWKALGRYLLRNLAG
jgi:hypothetical protein